MTPEESEGIRIYCELQGFDLARFDSWLATLEGLPVHQELTERRAMALLGIQANDEQRALRHLEWMLLRQQWITRADALVPRAMLGEKFTTGRKPGSISAVRKFVRSFIRKHPTATTEQVWMALATKPPRGIEVYEAHRTVGRYIRTVGKADTSFARFRNLVSQERPKGDQ